jgi:predicted DNA-binding WGR domain protein
VDTDGHYANANLLDRYLMQPSILRAFGWQFALVLTKDWYHNPDDVLARLEKVLQGGEAAEDTEPVEEEPAEPETQPAPAPAVPEATAPETSEAEEKKVATVPPAPPPVSKPGAARMFEFTGGTSRKFWQIILDGNEFAVRFGRIGTMGQSQTKRFADEATAKREAGHLIAEKLKKGYVEKT